LAFDRIISRLNLIQAKMKDLKQWCPNEKDKFLKDRKGQAAVERNIQVIIQAILEICIQFVKLLELEPPKSDESAIKSLKKYLKHTDLILELKKFRNFLVHIYGQVDTAIVYEHAIKMMTDIPVLLTEFQKFLDNNEQKGK